MVRGGEEDDFPDLRSWGAGCLNNRVAQVKPPCARGCRALGLVEPLLLHGCLLGCSSAAVLRHWPEDGSTNNA